MSVTRSPQICEEGGRGFLFPVIATEHLWPPALRALLYAAAMMWLFIGVAIVADKFVAAIESVTAKKLRVKVRGQASQVGKGAASSADAVDALPPGPACPDTQDGQNKDLSRIRTVKLWNPTVANLTLMALGSSAPEILLSCVEVIGKGFHFRGLGPSTIVGSAAFNLFVIIAVCIMAIPSPDIRMIKEIRVFHVTAAFSIFAYLWLFFIISVASPDIVEIWEGALTLLMMPILVLVSYLFDIGVLGDKGPPVLGKARMPKQSGQENHDRQHGAALTSSSSSASLADDGKSSHTRGSICGEGDHGILDGQVLDKDGVPIKNKNGVFTFESDMLEIYVASEERHLVVPILRCNGSKGEVTCNYRTERLTAMPGYDYIEAEGTLTFAQGVTRCDVSITLLPKKPMEHSDEFQVVLDEVTGGAVFNVNDDGGEDTNILTVTVLNGHEGVRDCGWGDRLLTVADGTLNFDEIRFGTLAWLAEIRDAVLQVTDDEEEQPGCLDYVMHVVSVPWKVLFAAFVPPPNYRSGWPCFGSAIIFIGLLTVVVLDFAELIGCVCQLDESVVAITLVALGTSMPDLFASKSAACDDPYADASIINVTGSNSVNVFLGVGLPWTIAAIHWTVVGATEEWQYMYPTFATRFPKGAFVVQGGDSLGFSVFVFVLAAFVALTVISGRRFKFGGELGGPLLFKLMSSLLMGGLWIFFVALTIWSAQALNPTFADRVGMVALGFCILFAVVSALSAVLTCVLRAWPQEQPEPESEPDATYASVLPQQTAVVKVASESDGSDVMDTASKDTNVVERKPKDPASQPPSQDQDLILPNVPTPPGGSEDVSGAYQ